MASTRGFTLFVNSGAPALTLDPRKLKIVWMGSQHADMINVGHVAYNDTLDIASCVVTPQEGEALGFLPTMVPIDTAVPSVGASVRMVSLDGMTAKEHVPLPMTARGRRLRLPAGLAFGSVL